MRRFYYFLNVSCVLFFLSLILNAQTTQKPDTTDKIPNVDKTITVDTKTKDSLLKVANRELDIAIKVSTVIPKKKEELLKAKLNEQRAMKNYIAAVNNYLQQSGRREKVIIKSSLKEQLKEGEIMLTKDSTCTKSKKAFLGKKKCVEWRYTWYLEDKSGKKERLW